MIFVFCPKCGNKFEEDAAFCPVCGTRKPDIAPPEPPTSEKSPAVKEVETPPTPSKAPEPVGADTFTEQTMTAIPFDKNKFEPVIKKTTQYYSAEFEKYRIGNNISAG